MKIAASLLIVLALVAAIVPQFTDCHSQGLALTLQNGKTVEMKCHWTAEAALAVSIPLMLLGGLMLFNKKKETLRALSIMGLALGAGMALLPTYLIGVCASPMMLCRSIMFPTLILTGALTMLISGVILALNWKGEAPAAPISQAS